MAVALLAAASAAVLAPVPGAGPPAPAGAQAATSPGPSAAFVRLTLLGRHDLASPGLDGAVRPRGNNGDVVLLGNTAFVGGGSTGHDAHAGPGRVCTDWGGVKVVDVSDPTRPTLRTTITMVDGVGVGAGPLTNPRRGVRLDNVAVSASAVDALAVTTPTFAGDLLAVAVQRCEPPLTVDGRIEFYDVTDPSRPARIAVFATSPPPGGWGVVEDVRLFVRDGRPHALATFPFSGGDVRLIDLGDPRNPTEVGRFPSGPDMDRSSVNGCKTAVAGRTAVPTAGGRHALASLYDGTASLEPNTGALVDLNLDDLPRALPGSDPIRFSPVPPHIGYPPEPRMEGNAGDVLAFQNRAGTPFALVSEDDLDPAVTNLAIEGPGFTAFDGRVCEPAVGSRAYQYPGQRLRAPVVHVGPACPGQALAGETSLAAEPPLADPRGAIAVADAVAGCTPQERLDYLAGQGALAVVQDRPFLDTVGADPNGGYPSIPNVVAPSAAARAVQYAPGALLAGDGFPTSWVRTVTTNSVTLNLGAPGNALQLIVRPTTAPIPVGATLVFPNNVAKVASAAVPVGAGLIPVVPSPGSIPNRAVGAVTNVTVRPAAVAVLGATTTSPVTVTTAAHGLATGDRVAIADVAGNPAANGEWAVTVLSPTTFSLDASVGGGTYAGGGYVVFCPAGSGGCGATSSRTDRSRHQSRATAEDRSARGQVAAGSRFAVVAGRTYEAGATLEVQQVTAGVFRAGAVWYDAGEAVIGRTSIAELGAAGPAGRYRQTMVAPPGAVRAGLEYEWTGATAEGVASAQHLTFGPAGLTATLRADQGEWGAQRVVDLGEEIPAEVATYRSPGSGVWPPPDDGLYAPRQARLFGADLAFTTWLSDGLRVVDLSTPDQPREVGSFVPPGAPDPSGGAGAGPTDRRGAAGTLFRGRSWPSRPLVTGVDVRATGRRSGVVVVSDVNAGLYVLAFDVDASQGYWSVATDGGVFAFGAAPFLGSMGGVPLTSPVVGLASTPSGRGYWLVAADGGVFAFGDAAFFGSTGAMRLNSPVVGMAATTTGRGYWLVAADGGIFAFGDAAFAGSTGALRLSRPVVGMAPTPAGRGYWLVAADGGIFSFGDARFRGSTGDRRLNRPVVAMTASAGGDGYWLVASDGGIFAFGDAAFLGSTGAIRLNLPVVGMSGSEGGRGYRLVASDGGIFTFGDAAFLGSTGAIRLNAPVVGMTTMR